MEQENIWAMVRKDNGKLIDSLGLVPDPKRENPYALIPDHQCYCLRIEGWERLA